MTRTHSSIMTRSISTWAGAALTIALLPAGSAAQPPSEDVTLKAADGVTLKATYYSPRKPGPGIVLLHQCNRDRKAWAAFAEAAVARGYHVIAPDFRGFGESQGERLDSLPQQQASIVAQKWPGDVDAAYAWLVAQEGVDKERIAAAGASCGVNQAVLLARRHPQVRTVMLLSGPVTQPGREYLRESPWLPVLAAASRDDGNALDTMRWTLGWSRNPSNRLVEYKAAGHGTEMFSEEKGLQPLMIDWLEAQLKRSPLERAPATTATPPSPVEVFWTTLTQPGGAAKARLLYEETRRTNKAVMLFPEAEANAYGYELLGRGDSGEAIIVFEMNVDANPQSANTYDSLSDAYLAAGKRDEALRFAEKTLQVLVTDTTTPEVFKATIRESAEKKISELKKKKTDRRP
jgi:dienelactone hydrolase